ncbi:myoD family inhibitor isoform X2 [Lampris incognitus]|uniref:myoD family inhibitor isoform X2 n=1 Tax=Lampris incognitus TaxID=2546036 RepID=UPI0024B5A6BE|nr:myoD family inhibitor isoform X2 [Lampris incognitus]
MCQQPASGQWDSFAGYRSHERFWFGVSEHATEEAPPPCPDGTEHGDSGSDSLTDSMSTDDVCRLLPAYKSSARPLQIADGKEGLFSLRRSEVSPPPICAPPAPSNPPSASCTSSVPHTPPLPPHSNSCKRTSGSHHHHHQNHHQSSSKKRLSSTKSHASLKTDPAHIKEVAGGDCCVHCLLACLFCEILSMCSVFWECLACGGSGLECCEATGCCCCVEAAGGVACTEEACQAVLDCGILEDCCGSSDCLEICLECCSICFPS